MGKDVIKHTLATDVANAGTFTVGYQAGKSAGSYDSGYDHMLVSNKYGTLRAGAGASFSFGASAVTITNSSGVTLEAGSEFYIQLDQPGKGEAYLADPESMGDMSMVLISLGAPTTIDPDGICEAQSNTGAHVLNINGALAGGTGKVVLDVPRNVIVDSGGADTATITIEGFDVFGAKMSEAIQLNGTTAVAGKKAFKTITKVSSSATIANGAFIGNGDVLGLPVFLPEVGFVMKELQDGAAATAGTVVKGLEGKSTTTTADVRGTYAPNAASNGSRKFSLLVMLEDPAYRGVAQA